MRSAVIGSSVLALAAAGLVAGGGASASASTGGPPVGDTALPSSITITGHGYGPGVGMGQYGAYGYALAGQTSAWILGHYYGGTTPTVVDPSQVIDVHLDEYDGHAPVTVTGPGLVHTTTGADTTYRGTGPLSVAAPGAPTRTFLGSIVVKGGVDAGQVWDAIGLDDYVAGVVPAESIASWGIDGEAALEAQAVAARSYALAYIADRGVICDTTTCQVYDGDQDVPGSPTYSSYTHYSDAAVTATSGEVLVCAATGACGAAGAVADTQFSSSTGGWTAGGAFPAVIDEGDATPSNPNHNWSTTVTTTSIEDAWPSIGTLLALDVTARNGDGTDGGRVLDVALSGSAGHVMVTGRQFYEDLGLRSDWFSIGSGGGSGGTDGYWVVAGDGGIFTFGQAGYHGSTGGEALNRPIVGMSATPDGGGYWLVASDGGIFSFGDAAFHGSTGALRLNKPVIAMASTPDGQGYWLLASDGGIFTFGDAGFHGSTGAARLNQPIVGMAPTPDGKGYWLVAADGGIFTFGDAGFYGSTGDLTLNQPIVGMMPTPDGRGYSLVGRDGGIFTFGDAPFLGSLPGSGVTDTVAGVTPTADGAGYLEVSTGGRVYSFGDAPYLGDPATGVPGWTGTALGIVAHRAP